MNLIIPVKHTLLKNMSSTQKKALILSENASCDFVFVSQLLGAGKKIRRQEDTD